MSAVVEVMWLASTRRVRGVAWPSIVSTKPAASKGSGTATRTSFAPRSAQMRSKVAMQAPYSSSSVSTSSPGCRSSERATMFTAVVALGT